MIHAFESILKHSKEYKELVTITKNRISPIQLVGLGGSSLSIVLSQFSKDTEVSQLIITASESEAKRLYEDLSVINENVLHFPYKEVEFFDVFADSHQLRSQRSDILNRLTFGDEALTVIASIESALQTHQPKSKRSKSLSFSFGEELNRDQAILDLVEMGYEMLELVDSEGQMSRRGGILDIFPIGFENPVRIEFFGDEIDSIRTFDVTNQISIEKIQTVQVLPCREYISSSEGSLERNIPLIETKLDLLMDYFDGSSVIIFVDPIRIGDRAENFVKEFRMRFTEHFEKGELDPKQIQLISDFDHLRMGIGDRRVLLTDLLSKDPRYFKPAEIINFNTSEAPNYLGKIEGLKNDLETYKYRGYKIILSLDGQEKAQKLRDSLVDLDFSISLASSKHFEVLSGQAVIIDQPLKEGFIFSSFKMVLITEKEIFGYEVSKKYKKRASKERVIKSFTDLSEGDLVVHENHGIGRYIGIDQITVDSNKKDYLKIKYSGDDFLYIPVEQMDSLQKYIGGGEDGAKLSKLGGIEWKRAKAKVKKSIEDMTDDLVKLYAARKSLVGHAFQEDDEWQRQFEDLFPYVETDDQLKCIREIKEDMQSTMPMERLLCGDVGYGKTEVAIRAIFKAVMDSKQAAVLVPTTILAQQHYNNMKERFSKFPVKVEMLSRFRTKKQQEEIIKNLNDGLIDVIVGTHRILSKDITFNKLGLLVIDEEQRFGVKHKESIKRMKKNIDVLSMSATPIPRTLHLSLSGIRDMSIIEDPPEDRYPIQTYVVEYNMDIVREALIREIGRGGQVYVVHNRVQDIDQFSVKIASLVPDIEVRFAHGQMNEHQLEKIMMDFMNKEFDVLVSTTIIETGLDISNVNTIIINDADKMGLSQLYQLRGRVGRSNRVAYAYLLYQKDKVLSEIAEKRLKSIKEFTELGSGFRIAMRDLELRGAGNVLGAEQHGHMATVGYELYCKMMEDAMMMVKGIKVESPVETQIEFGIDAFIPDELIPVPEHKLDIYKRIAAIKVKKDCYNVAEEIEDRFGTLPQSVYNLIDVAYLKALCQKLRITSLSEDEKGVVCRFDKESPVTPTAIVKLDHLYGKQFKFLPHPKPHFRFHFKDAKAEKMAKLNETVTFVECFLGFIDDEIAL